MTQEENTFLGRIGHRALQRVAEGLGQDIDLILAEQIVIRSRKIAPSPRARISLNGQCGLPALLLAFKVCNQIIPGYSYSNI